MPFTNIFQPSLIAIVPLAVFCCFPDSLDNGALPGITMVYLFICVMLFVHKHTSDAINRVVYYIGKNTLVIYLFSPVFTMSSKAFLPYLQFDHTGMLFLIIAVTFTIIGGLAIAWTMDKLHLSRWFFGKDKVLS